jgi:Tfp pilus assembly protein PilZ
MEKASNGVEEKRRPGVERRDFPRYAVSIPVRFSSEMMDFYTTAEIVTGRVADISRGGFFVRSDFLEVSGTPVRLLFELSQSHVFSLAGHVAWIERSPPKGPGMGIRLSDGPMEAELFDQLYPNGD